MGPQTANNPLQYVAITVTLNSADTVLPYDVTGISGTAVFANGTSIPISNWAKEELGVPRSQGADLQLQVLDTATWPAGTTVQITAWILTFLPRPNTTQASPVRGNRVLTGTQPISATNRLFKLVDPSTQPGNQNLLANTGDWDWSLMVQMRITDASGNATFKTFVSDPEMEMEN